MKTAGKKSSKKSSSKKAAKKGHGIRVVNGDDSNPIDAATGVAEVGALEAPAAEPQPEAGALEAAYGVAQYPIAELKLNTLRMPSDAAVDEMVKSIKKIGLQNAVIADANGDVISGNTRILAYKKLGRTHIPARFAVDEAGNAITKDDVAATVAGLAENLVRTNMTPVELGRAALDAIKRGVATNEKELASKIGVSTGHLNRAIAIAQKACGPIADSIASGELTVDAGVAIVTRCADHDLQREALEMVRAAVKGKNRAINRGDVEQAVPEKGGREARTERRGRKVEKIVLPAEATNAAESGIRATLRRASDGGKVIALDIEIHTNAETFARFDLEDAIQKAAAKIVAASARKELEAARQRLFA